MVGTFQALSILLLAILPGAVLVFSFERHAGAVAGDANERLVRFVIGTVVVFPCTAILAAWTYSRVVHAPIEGSPGEFTNRLEEPLGISPAWTLLPLVYVLVPWCLGWALGEGVVWLRRRAVNNRTTSRVPGVAAWDIVFLAPGPKLIAAKLRGGPWIGGMFASNSFASPLASRRKELVLEAGVQIDQVSGQIERDETKTPILLPGAIVLNYADVELLVVEPT
jgi:Family of unknown function (DUF6338)